jgi:uncharacterized protein DUF4340
MKSNILLAFVAASLALLAYTERQTVPSPTPVAAPEQPSESLFSMQPQEIDLIKVLDSRGCLVVRREGTPPRDGEGLVESIVAARVVRRFSPPLADFSAYGLAPPARRIEVKWTNGAHSRSVAIGNLNPVGNAVYARIDEGADVVLVGSYFLTSLDMALQRLRAAGSKLVDPDCSA